MAARIADMLTASQPSQPFGLGAASGSPGIGGWSRDGRVMEAGRTLRLAPVGTPGHDGVPSVEEPPTSARRMSRIRAGASGGTRPAIGRGIEFTGDVDRRPGLARTPVDLRNAVQHRFRLGRELPV